MKFLVLRTDLKRKLKYIRLVVIDSGIFASGLINGSTAPCDNIDREILGELVSDKVSIVLCSDNYNGKYENMLNATDIRHISLDGLSYAEIMERLCADYGVNKTEVAFINNSCPDPGLLSGLGFPVATIDAAMEIKTGSYYVSNFTGVQTFNEIIGVIVSAKNS